MASGLAFLGMTQRALRHFHLAAKREHKEIQRTWKLQGKWIINTRVFTSEGSMGKNKKQGKGVGDEGTSGRITPLRSRQTACP